MPMPKERSTSTEILLARIDERQEHMAKQFEGFLREYKEQNAATTKRQDDQFATVMKRITDIDTWRAREIQPTRVLKWDEAARKVDAALDDQKIKRQETIFKAVEPHIDKDGELEGLVWLNKTRDRWGLVLAALGLVLSFLGTLFYMLLDNVIIPMFTRKGGM